MDEVKIRMEPRGVRYIGIEREFREYNPIFVDQSMNSERPMQINLKRDLDDIKVQENVKGDLLNHLANYLAAPDVNARIYWAKKFNDIINQHKLGENIGFIPEIKK